MAEAFVLEEVANDETAEVIQPSGFGVSESRNLARSAFVHVFLAVQRRAGDNQGLFGSPGVVAGVDTSVVPGWAKPVVDSVCVAVGSMELQLLDSVSHLRRLAYEARTDAGRKYELAAARNP